MASRRAWAVVLRLALVLAPASFAPAGSLSGRVVRDFGAGIPYIFIDLFDRDGNWFDFTATDANGRFQFTNLGAGVFYVHTDTLGAYADEWFDNVSGASDRAFFDPLYAGATPVDVGLTSTVSGIDFSLSPAGRIVGTVRTEGGGAITNVYVDACLPAGGRFRSAVTGDDGTYVIDGLPAGLYAVRTDTLIAYKDEWHDGKDAFDLLSAQESGVFPLNVASGATIGGIDFSLSPGGRIEGTVRTAGGSPVPGAIVDLYSTADVPLEFDRTDGDGVFVLGGLPAGAYYLGTDTLGSYVDLWHQQKIIRHPGQPSVDGADAVVLPAQGAITGIVFTMEAGAEVSGRVETEEGAPVADAFIDVFLGGNFFDYAITETDGAFNVPALPDGVYYLKTDTLGEFLDEWYEDHVVYDTRDPLGDGADPLVITAGQSLTGLVLRLRRGAEILGRVTDAEGQPIADTYVDLCDAAGKRLFSTKNDAAGDYRLGGLPSGTYYLRTDAVASFIDEWFDDRIVLHPRDPAADNATPLTVAGTDRLAGIDLALERGGSISGVVTGPSGNPVVAGSIKAFRGNVYYAVAAIQADGAYRVRGLPAGTYYLRTDVRADLVNEWYRDVYIFRQGLPEEDGATPVPLTAEQDRTGIDFALGYGGDIRGTVRTDAAIPLADIIVDLYDAQGRFYDFALTFPDGSYLLELLPPGVWYAGTDTFGACIDEWYDNVERDLGDPLEDGATPLELDDGVAIVGVDFELLPAPPPAERIQSILRDGASVLIRWQGREGVAYQVERAADPAPWTWSEAPSGPTPTEHSYKAPGPAGPREYRDPEPPVGTGAYRVGAF